MNMNKFISLLIKHYKIILITIVSLIIEVYFTLTLPQYTANIVDIGIKTANMPYIYDTGNRLIEQGTHDELIAQKGYYYNILKN